MDYQSFGVKALLVVGLLVGAAWFGIAKHVTKSDKMPEPEIMEYMKRGTDSVNSSANRDVNDWLHIEKAQFGSHWFGFVLTVNAEKMPSECEPDQFGLPKGCINASVFGKYYCQFEDFRKLPSASIMNEIEVSYELNFDEGNGGEAPSNASAPSDASPSEKNELALPPRAPKRHYTGGFNFRSCESLKRA
ncbi:hypothetical protein [Chitinimonas sp.]|uniref:hypothetical protein n=1 Tax=Chitinimonas sp. TaxID=1934313 RepID=UPI0035AFFE5E